MSTMRSVLSTQSSMSRRDMSWERISLGPANLTSF